MVILQTDWIRESPADVDPTWSFATDADNFQRGEALQIHGVFENRATTAVELVGWRFLCGDCGVTMDGTERHTLICRVKVGVRRRYYSALRIMGRLKSALH